MRTLIVTALLLVTASAQAATDADLAKWFAADSAWVARLHRAVAWNSGQESVTADGIVADLKGRLEHLITFEEEKHGIDPETQAQTPQALISALEAERAAKVAVEAQKEATAAALVAVTAERDSLKAVLAAPKAAEPMIEEVPAELTP